MSDQEIQYAHAVDSKYAYQEYLAGRIMPLLQVYDLLKAAQNFINTANANKECMQKDMDIEQMGIELEEKIQDFNLPWLPWHSLSKEGLDRLKAELIAKYGADPSGSGFWSGSGANEDRLKAECAAHAFDRIPWTPGQWDKRPELKERCAHIRPTFQWTDWFKDGKVCNANTPGAKQYTVTFALFPDCSTSQDRAGGITLNTPQGPNDQDTSCQDLGLPSDTSNWKENQGVISGQNANNTFVGMSNQVTSFNESQKVFRESLDERQKLSTNSSNKAAGCINQFVNAVNNLVAIIKELLDMTTSETQAVMRGGN